MYAVPARGPPGRAALFEGPANTEEELAKIHRNLALEQAEKDRQIALIEKAKQEELAQIALAAGQQNSFGDDGAV